MTLTLLTGSGCSSPPKAEVDPNVVAWVDGEAIARDAFAVELARELRSLSEARSPAQVEPAKQALLDGMITRVLLLRAAHDAGVAVTDDELDRRMLGLESDYPAGSFDDALAQGGIARSELLQRTRERLTIERLIDAEVHRRVAVTEEQVRRTFEEHLDEFRVPERVHARQILVRSLDEASRLKLLLRSGKPFAELARRYSVAPEARLGGDLGIFPRGQMPPAFDAVLFALTPGQVSEVTATEHGFHLFQVVQRWSAATPSLGEIRSKVEERVLVQLRHERERELVQRLRAGARVRVNDDVLSSLQLSPGR